MPVDAHARREQARLVITASTQALAADGYPCDGVERAGEVLRRRLGHQLAEAVQAAELPLELQAVYGLAHRALVVERGRGRAEAAVHNRALAGIGERLAALVTEQLAPDDTAAEGALPREEEIHHAARGTVQIVHQAHVSAPSFSLRRRPL